MQAETCNTAEKIELSSFFLCVWYYIHVVSEQFCKQANIFFLFNAFYFIIFVRTLICVHGCISFFIVNIVQDQVSYWIKFLTNEIMYPSFSKKNTPAKGLIQLCVGVWNTRDFRSMNEANNWILAKIFFALTSPAHIRHIYYCTM